MSGSVSYKSDEPCVQFTTLAEQVRILEPSGNCLGIVLLICVGDLLIKLTELFWIQTGAFEG